MADTSSNQNLSKIIEERIRLVKQMAKESFNENEYSRSLDEFLEKHEYAITLEKLYELVRKKAPEVLPEIEKLVEENIIINDFDTHKLEAIREYIAVYIPLAEYDKTRNQKIQNLKKGLEYLSKPDVDRKLSNFYWDVYSGKSLPQVNSYLKQIEKYLKDSTNLGLDWKTEWYVLENAAYNYLYSHIRCLLSNPDEYMQHMKTGDLEDFIRESCKS
jgi:hypothetical protein